MNANRDDDETRYFIYMDMIIWSHGSASGSKSTW